MSFPPGVHPLPKSNRIPEEKKKKKKNGRPTSQRIFTLAERWTLTFSQSGRRWILRGRGGGRDGLTCWDEEKKKRNEKEKEKEGKDNTCITHRHSREKEGRKREGIREANGAPHPPGRCVQVNFLRSIGALRIHFTYTQECSELTVNLRRVFLYLGCCLPLTLDF